MKALKKIILAVTARKSCDDFGGSVQPSGVSLSNFIANHDIDHSSDRRIRFVSCSATLANPSEYMSKMFGLDSDDIEVVFNDGAPSGSKEYLIWNPALVDPKNPSLGRKSSLTEASNLMRFLMKKGIRVILFCKVLPPCSLSSLTVNFWSTKDPKDLRVGTYFEM